MTLAEKLKEEARKAIEKFGCDYEIEYYALNDPGHLKTATVKMIHTYRAAPMIAGAGGDSHSYMFVFDEDISQLEKIDGGSIGGFSTECVQGMRIYYEAASGTSSGTANTH